MFTLHHLADSHLESMVGIVKVMHTFGLDPSRDSVFYSCVRLHYPVVSPSPIPFETSHIHFILYTIWGALPPCSSEGELK